VTANTPDPKEGRGKWILRCWGCGPVAPGLYEIVKQAFLGISQASRAFFRSIYRYILVLRGGIFVQRASVYGAMDSPVTMNRMMMRWRRAMGDQQSNAISPLAPIPHSHSLGVQTTDADQIGPPKPQSFGFQIDEPAC